MPAIETSLGRLAEPEGDRVEFIVRTDVPAYQAGLPRMGWQPTGDPGSFTRRFDDAPGVEAIFERFTRHIETGPPERQARICRLKLAHDQGFLAASSL